MLANHNSREVLDKFKIPDTNWEALKASRQKISKDKRKKEWVIFKERNILVFGKITKKTNGRFTLTHWKSENPKDISWVSFTKCKGCSIGRKNNSECLISKPTSKWHQVISKIAINETGSAISEIPLSAFLKKVAHYSSEELETQNSMQIKILNREEAIIKRIIEDENIWEDLNEIVEKLRGRKRLNIYTDRSLACESTGDTKGKKIGIG